MLAIGLLTLGLSYFANAGLRHKSASLSQDHECQSDRLSEELVDYVIVGGGPAGFVLAEQLSLNPNVTVILLEAGPDGTEAAIINVPGYAGRIEKPKPAEFLWNFTSQPDPNLNGATPALAQGHVLGGGSAVTYLAYCRGAPSVFDKWASISGDDELRWENLLHDFEATTHFANAPASYDSIVNTSVYCMNTSVYCSGPLEVSRAGGLNGLDPYYLEALKDTLDVPEVDFSAGYGIGAAYGVETIRVSNRTRGYALEAFGWQLASRPNVRILHSAWATHIGFRGKHAVNVTYIATSDNTTRILHFDELIISAGAINSPKLLMLSGIGPASHLQDLGIPIVADIPEVGRNLYDHHQAPVEVEVTSSVQTSWQFLYNATFTHEALASYAANGSGYLSNSASYGIARVPDSIFAGIDTTLTALPADRGHLLFQGSTAPFIANSPNVSIASPFAALGQPEGSGHVLLASASYLDNPLIYSNYFGSPGDKAAILYGYKTLRRVLQSPILSSIVVREIYPGPNVTTDEQIWAAIQKGAQTFHHPVGTCALGKVVDANWRVMGLRGVRVVDSSTFPSPPNCHLQASVYAYAHRAARKIRQEDKRGRH